MWEATETPVVMTALYPVAGWKNRNVKPGLFLPGKIVATSALIPKLASLPTTITITIRITSMNVPLMPIVSQINIAIPVVHLPVPVAPIASRPVLPISAKLKQS